MGISGASVNELDKLKALEEWQETISTEKSYLAQLRFLNHNSKAILESFPKKTKKGEMSKKDLKQAFDILPDLIAAHEKLLKTFEEKQPSEWEAALKETLPDAQKFVSLYYEKLTITPPEEVRACMEQLSKAPYLPIDPKTDIDTKTNQPKLDPKNLLPLPAFLITPVQRFPRYVMLFEGLVKRVNEDKEFNDEKLKTTLFNDKLDQSEDDQGKKQIPPFIQAAKDATLVINETVRKQEQLSSVLTRIDALLKKSKDPVARNALIEIRENLKAQVYKPDIKTIDLSTAVKDAAKTLRKPTGESLIASLDKLSKKDKKLLGIENKKTVQDWITTGIEEKQKKLAEAKPEENVKRPPVVRIVKPSDKAQRDLLPKTGKLSQNYKVVKEEDHQKIDKSPPTLPKRRP